jgi:hypothetical protein
MRRSMRVNSSPGERHFISGIIPSCGCTLRFTAIGAPRSPSHPHDGRCTSLRPSGAAGIGVGRSWIGEQTVQRLPTSRKQAFDDAINSTRAAVAECVVPGGGLALLRAIEAVEAGAAHCEGEQHIGVLLLRRALEAPARQIAANSGADPGVVVDRMRSGSGAFGFDAAVGQYVDLIEAGIIDPTKVLRVALENAVSVASVLLLTEATLTQVPEQEKELAAGAGDELEM